MKNGTLPSLYPSSPWLLEPFTRHRRMNLLGLELSDAGILVAGGEPPRLLGIDEDSLESPGFALPEKKALSTGIAAERRARLFPRQIMNRFWDSLSTDPLDPPLPAAGNQAEVACAHLARIWNQARRSGNALVIAVPAYFQRTQLGAAPGDEPGAGHPRAGVCQSARGGGRSRAGKPAPARGRAPASLRGVHSQGRGPPGVPGGADGQRERPGRALQTLGPGRRQGVRAHDPLRPVSQRRNRAGALPPPARGAGGAAARSRTTTIAIPAGHSTYSVNLVRAMILETAKPVYDELLAAVRDAGQRGAAPGTATAVQVSQRAARLPGILERLRRMPNTRVVELPAGAAALALPALWRELTGGRPPAGASFSAAAPGAPRRLHRQ
ncbi:MAG: hypothetical protein MZU91_00605 [Desulfosudis oleivorans]|nr:hypothetical protein [Desulfosudis oleivorans]